jgi:HlyD family secretion protein
MKAPLLRHRVQPVAAWLSLFLVGLILIASPPLGADEPNPGKVVLEAKGYVVPASQVTVSPSVSGHVIDILIEEGKRVKKGDILARLDPTAYDAALGVARAKLNMAEAALAKASEGSDKGNLSIARANVEVAQARLTVAKLGLNGTIIIAPIDGTILLKRAELGTLINPKAYQATGSLCDMADLRMVDVEVSVAERDISKITKGQPCLIRLEAFPGSTYRGQVGRLLPVADRAKGCVGVRVQIDVPENDEKLRPESGAIVQFLGK